MAGTSFNARVRSSHADTSEHCLLEIIAPTNQALVIRRIEYSEGGVSGTAARTRLRSTMLGTASDGTVGSAAAVSKGDGDQTITLQTTVRGIFTVDPATTAEIVAPYGGEADPQRGLNPWVGYLRIKQGTRFRIYGTAAATTTFTLLVQGEE